MKKVIREVITWVLMILAGFMSLAVILMCSFSIGSMLNLGYVAIILYCLIPKSWSYVGISLSIIAACLYLYALFLSIFYQPGSVLLSALLPIMAVLAMLKGRPLWMWGLVGLIFMTIGVFSLFYNDIIGPMAFMIRDRPFDVPAQWGHCYRLFWSAALFKMVAYRAGILSILVMGGYLLNKRYRKPCERLEV
jgi:hypothetical protein